MRQASSEVVHVVAVRRARARARRPARGCVAAFMLPDEGVCGEGGAMEVCGGVCVCYTRADRGYCTVLRHTKYG